MSLAPEERACERCGQAMRRRATERRFKWLNRRYCSNECRIATQAPKVASLPGGGRGDRHPFAKLTAESVLEIRRLAATGVPGRVLGPAFGVSESTISSVVRGKTWKHLLPRDCR